MWDAATTDEFDTWFTELGESREGVDAQVEIDAVVTLLRTIGPTLGRPTVDTLAGSKHANLKELRVSASGMVLRIAFAFDPLQKAILLVGGDKGGVNQQRFYKQLIRKADKEYDRHLAAIKTQVEAKQAARAKKAKRKGS